MPKTTYPTLRSQSYDTWRDTIKQERENTSLHIASLEVTTELWRQENPRRDRCERSWSF